MSTVQFMFDEDVDQRLLRGLKRREPGIDVVTVHDVGLGSQPDLHILRWAADHARVLVTQDVNTMTRHLFDEIQAGHTTPGVIFIPRNVSVGEAIENLVLVWAATQSEDWSGRYDFLPL